MGKPKFRVAHSYRGRRRRVYRKLASTHDEVRKVENIRPVSPLLPSSFVRDSPDLASSSSRKLNMLGSSSEMNDNYDISSGDGFFITHISSLNKMLSSVLCQKCLSSKLSFRIIEGENFGLAVKGAIHCCACEEKLAEQYMSDRVGESASSRGPFEVNLRAVVAFRGIGCGQSEMQSWCGTMNMPSCVSSPAYQAIKSKLNTASKEAFEELSRTAQEAITAAYKEIGVVPDSDGVLDIGVSYDGSWHKRGHSSHTGIGVVIDLLTGLPIDYEVLSNFCLKCQLAPPKSDESYKCWEENHAKKCLKNYEGSANSMEMECAQRIWKRSERKYKFRYTTLLSDGDSKTYDNLLKVNVYGDEIEIKKEECVNHVAKRMGTALNNLVSQCKAEKSSISGKGQLTREKIIKIQNYYGRAIKDNAPDICLMKKRIFAILYHLCSSDKEPKHVHCPPGENSWCFWQRALAKGSTPGKHKEHETLPPAIGKKMVPIFHRLSEEKLLSRCTLKRTQNNNESLHSLVWSFCPKRNFVGRITVENAVCMAILQFSLGSTFKEALCKLLGFSPGAYLKQCSKKKDRIRLIKAEEASSDVAKRRRKELKYQKSGAEKKRLSAEGDTYQSGSFD